MDLGEYCKALGEEVPDWPDIIDENNRAFYDWLRERDPSSPAGYTGTQLLKAAIDSLDPVETVRILKRFKSEISQEAKMVGVTAFFGERLTSIPKKYRRIL